MHRRVCTCRDPTTLTPKSIRRMGTSAEVYLHAPFRMCMHAESKYLDQNMRLCGSRKKERGAFAALRIATRYTPAARLSAAFAASNGRSGWRAHFLIGYADADRFEVLEPGTFVDCACRRRASHMGTASIRGPDQLMSARPDRDKK